MYRARTRSGALGGPADSLFAHLNVPILRAFIVDYGVCILNIPLTGFVHSTWPPVFSIILFIVAALKKEPLYSFSSRFRFGMLS